MPQSSLQISMRWQSIFDDANTNGKRRKKMMAQFQELMSPIQASISVQWTHSPPNKTKMKTTKIKANAKNLNLSIASTAGTMESVLTLGYKDDAMFSHIPWLFSCGMLLVERIKIWIFG